MTGGRPESSDPLGAGVNAFYAGSDGGMLAARIRLESGNPEVQLLDKSHNIRFKAALDSDGNASLELLIADGTVVWSAP